KRAVLIGDRAADSGLDDRVFIPGFDGQTRGWVLGLAFDDPADYLKELLVACSHDVLLPHHTAEWTEVSLATPVSAPLIAGVLKDLAIIRREDRSVVTCPFV